MDEQPTTIDSPTEHKRHEAAMRYTAERQELFLMLQDMVVEEVSRQLALKEKVQEEEAKQLGFWQKLARAFS